ncbi:MAG: type II/IV secretion system protein [bacterium]|nr:type II/IV secretion system protein [bacterium]
MTVLRFLALLAAAAGLGCLYLIRQPDGLAAAWFAIRDLTPGALGNPLVPIAAAVAVVSAVAARGLEGAPRMPRRDRDVHRLETPVELTATMPELVMIERAGDGARLDRHLHGRPDVPAFVDELLGAAVGAGASDVHVQPLDTGTRIAWRVGGELADVATAAPEHHELIVRRLKILAKLVTYQTDMPQDGRFTLETTGDAVDVRVSVLPTRHGEKVALRLARGGGLIALDRLGMNEPLRLRLEELLAHRQGLILLTGPTGCGKTTTLYGALAHIHEQRGDTTAIATIEDPIEIDLPFLSQTQIDKAAGLSFGEGLRSVLRQDPNVLMIGEIRDRETAHTAVEAGLSGHLILTTLHAESTAGVFNRLIDMDVEPFLASSSVLAAVSQRLARRLCRECRRPAKTDRKTLKRLLERGVTRTAAESLSFYTAKGCKACRRTGVRGRTAIFELLAVTPALRELVAQKVPTRKIEEAAIAAGMTPLFKAAVLEAVEGTISLEEALRVAG